jgi:hypothetical protein
VPNLATELKHSYHRSWLDSPHDNGYSVSYWGDKHIPRNAQQYACAIDITLPTQDLMIEYTSRFHRWAVGHKKSPVAKTIREFAGTLDGKTVYAMDTTSRNPYRTYGWDQSHLWHIHVSINRRLILSKDVLTIANLFKG